MEATMPTDDRRSRRKRIGRSFFRRNKEDASVRTRNERREESTPSPPLPSEDPPVKSREEAPAISTSRPRQTFEATVSPKSKSSRKNGSSARSGHPDPRRSVRLKGPPRARDAAFSGPPLFDWIDIETNAAIKVQAAFRRNKVMSELEEQGVTTAAIRNRARRRDANRRLATSEDTPSLFQCCGVGLAFGDGTEEDYEVERQLEKERYEAQKKEKEAQEEIMRKRYLKKKTSDHMIESVEVVE